MTTTYSLDTFAALDGFTDHNGRLKWLSGQQGPEFLAHRAATYREPLSIVLEDVRQPGDGADAHRRTGVPAIKHAQIEHETLRKLYLDLGDLADCAPDDPRLPSLADRMAAFVEAAAAHSAGAAEPQPIADDLVALLDSAFIESFPCASRLLELLQERGWTGWTNITRIDAAG